MKIAIVILSLFCFVSFSWSILKVFQKPDGMPSLMSLLSLAGLASWAFQIHALLTKPLTVLGVASGVGLFISSLVLFVWSIKVAARNSFNVAFTETAPSVVVTDGPYRFIRHPLYSSYLLFWLGGAVASQSMLVSVSVVAMLVLYVIAIRQEEKEFSDSGLSEEYLSYKQSAGALFPRLFVK